MSDKGDFDLWDESCPLCNGEACLLCGAGCWNIRVDYCNHDVIERHTEPELI